MRKGLVEFCILRSLKNSERYAYDLVKALVALPCINMNEGTIYPLLSRLRAAGLLRARLAESPEGPARKYYSLTLKGRVELRRMNRYFKTLSHIINQL